MTRIRLTPFIVLTLFILGTAIAWASDYIVKSGESLSSIAHQIVTGPVWGEHGGLKQLLDLNLSIKNPNLIYPGQIIQIPIPSQIATHSTKPLREPASDMVNSPTGVSPSEDPNQNPNQKPGQKPTVPIPSSSTSQPEPKSQAQTRSQVQADTATPSLAEAPATNASTDNIDQHFKADLGYHFKTYNAQDVSNASRAKIFTSTDVEFAVAWVQDWNPTISTFFEFDLEKLDLAPSNNPSKSLVNTAKSLARFSLGADIHASSQLVLSTALNYGQQVFTGSQNGNISIDSVLIPEVSEEIIFTAYNRGRTGLGIQGGGSYLFGTGAGTYSVNSGYSLNGALFLNQMFGSKSNHSLSLLLGYENTQQNTSIVNQTVDDVFAKLVFSMPIFGDEK